MRRSGISAQSFGNVSIHASVKDATIGTFALGGSENVSIHASVKDATFSDRDPYKEMQVSIHASVKDATLLHVIEIFGR